MNSSAGKFVCFIVDQEPGTRQAASSVLGAMAVELECFDTVAEMLKRRAALRPDLVLVDVTVDTTRSRDYLQALIDAKIDCPIRPMSGLNPLLRAESSRVWERSGLNVLSTITKPLHQQAIKDAVQSLNAKNTARSQITVTDVIDQRLYELWYQPRIDLQAQTLSGAEGFFRARRPDGTVITAAELLAHATETELLNLTTRLLSRAMSDWRTIRKLGVTLDVSINIPVCALKRLSLFSIFWQEGLDSPNFPRLTLELNESEIVPHMSLAFAAKKELERHQIKLAIDSFGMSYDEMLRYSELPFDEIKIDRSFICNCDRDALNAGLCELIVDFCHRYRTKAVAEGVETPGELRTLRKMGCDMAQGYLLAHPMRVAEFSALVQQRSVRHQ
jgi:EAL domain-containing protein (putative c-di-GMP-specific phosphodiesterase class I)